MTVEAAMIVTNETHEPLRVSLGAGKVLHLAPLGSANISTRAAERPAVQRMVEAGKIRLTSETDAPDESPGAGAGPKGQQPARIQRKGLQ